MAIISWLAHSLHR